MRSAFLTFLLLHGLCSAQTAAQEKRESSRELAIRIDQALDADPKVYPRELIEKCTAAAIAEIRTCQADPKIVARLKALPENTWMEMNEPESKGTPGNHHSFPRNRGEGSATYDGTTKGVVCFGGCGAPDYSCDLWVYKTGANRWFEVWPNIPRGQGWKRLAETPRDRPSPGCTLGLTYAAETGCIYRFVCANAGLDSPNVWESKVLTGKWEIVGHDRGMSAGGIRITADPVLHGLLAVHECMRLFSFRTREWKAIGTGGPKCGACYALTYLPRQKCALLICGPQPQEKLSWDGSPRQVETWLFHSTTQKWEQVKSKNHPEWYYRGGIAYDSVNDVVIFGGWKLDPPGNGPNVTPELWIFQPENKEWTFIRPKSGPSGRLEYFAYDPEYNVVVAAGNGHGTWVYRYKGTPPTKDR